LFLRVEGGIALVHVVGLKDDVSLSVGCRDDQPIYKSTLGILKPGSLTRRIKTRASWPAGIAALVPAP
jgi:hypothetical protein